MEGTEHLGTGNWKCAFLLREVISLSSTSAILFAWAQHTQLLPPRRVLRSKLGLSVLPSLMGRLLTPPPPQYPCTSSTQLAATGLLGQLTVPLFFFFFVPPPFLLHVLRTSEQFPPAFNVAKASPALARCPPALAYL